MGQANNAIQTTVATPTRYETSLLSYNGSGNTSGVSNNVQQAQQAYSDAINKLNQVNGIVNTETSDEYSLKDKANDLARLTTVVYNQKKGPNEQTITNAQKAAQSAVERAKNTLFLAQQAAANQPISHQLAVDWGRIADNAGTSGKELL